MALVCSGNVLGNSQHAGAGATQGRSCFLIIDEVGAEEDRVTHTYNAHIKGQKMFDNFSLINIYYKSVISQYIERHFQFDMGTGQFLLPPHI